MTNNTLTRIHLHLHNRESYTECKIPHPKTHLVSASLVSRSRHVGVNGLEIRSGLQWNVSNKHVYGCVAVKFAKKVKWTERAARLSALSLSLALCLFHIRMEYCVHGWNILFDPTPERSTDFEKQDLRLLLNTTTFRVSNRAFNWHGAAETRCTRCKRCVRSIAGG